MSFLPLPLPILDALAPRERGESGLSGLDRPLTRSESERGGAYPQQRLPEACSNRPSSDRAQARAPFYHDTSHPLDRWSTTADYPFDGPARLGRELLSHP